ncbi:MAG TPA: hypothetical protein VK735_39660 [Pseudonocardia sp.]|uniref:hypothetical protein n=1 Tax=Pseudonocardia sp. TaxID=60912 RepID=UPI002BDEE547|nr:hypothetical protein [Pseudonocardia sp.]HTF53600.1 hypothetical protein [Pseudonocardia sp.]
MTIVTAGFPGSYDDLKWSKFQGLIANDAVDSMVVSATTGDRNVSIGTGTANVGGIFTEVTVAQTFQFPSNTSGLSRIDLLVLDANWTTKTVVPARVPGTPSSNPQAPFSEVIRNHGTRYQLPIAQVIIDHNQGALASGDLTRVATPPPTDFYFIPSLATAPHPDLDSLMWYSPLRSLRIGINGAYREIAHARGKHLLRKSVTAGGSVPNAVIDFMGTMAINFSRGDGWDVGSQHSSQFQVPETGYYRVTAQYNWSRVISGQLGYVYLQLRGNTTANVPNSGSLLLESTEALVNGYLHGSNFLNDILQLNKGTRYHFAVSNGTTDTINGAESSGRSFFSVEQVDSIPAAP